MGRIEELIQQYCPDGVEYRPLSELYRYRRGSFPQPYTVAEFYGGENSSPFVQVADVSEKGLYLNNRTKQTISEIAKPKSVFVPMGTVVVTLQGTIGKVAITQYDAYVDRTLAIFTECLINDLNERYFAYALKHKFDTEKKKARGTTLKTITKEEFSSFEIPVPPLPVQAKIVQILDAFTELETDLETEFETELGLRQKQYEYYRDELLRFEGRDDVEWKPLSEIATSWERGNGIKRDEVTPNGQPCVRYGEIYTSYGLHFKECISHTSKDVIAKPKIARKGAILFAITGESVDDIATSTAYLGDADIFVGGDIVIMHHNQNAKYLSYALSTTDARTQKSKGKIKSKVVHTKIDDISKIVIPIPKSIDEQIRIAELLDKFNNLIADIDEGIPNEISLRQKQYEYYRDKLLNFKEIE